jgi:hypothetical protein
VSAPRGCVLALALALGSGASVACGVGVYSAAEPDAGAMVPASSDDGGDASTAPGDGATSADATADASTVTPLCPAPTSESFASEADGLIAEDSTQAFGNLSTCSTAVGRCLARFQLSAKAHTALVDRKVVTMSLTLRRADSSPDCSLGGSCVAFREAGQLSVVPARVDWDETKMTWLSSKVGSPWGAPGAAGVGTDVGMLAGSSAVAATDLTPAIPLDPKAWSADLLGTESLALRFEFLTVATRRQFLAVMHEPGALPHEPPKLSVTYCP